MRHWTLAHHSCRSEPRIDYVWVVCGSLVGGGVRCVTVVCENAEMGRSGVVGCPKASAAPAKPTHLARTPQMWWGPSTYTRTVVGGDPREHSTRIAYASATPPPFPSVSVPASCTRVRLISIICVPLISRSPSSESPGVGFRCAGIRVRSIATPRAHAVHLKLCHWKLEGREDPTRHLRDSQGRLPAGLPTLYRQLGTHAISVLLPHIHHTHILICTHPVCELRTSQYTCCVASIHIRASRIDRSGFELQVSMIAHV